MTNPAATTVQALLNGGEASSAALRAPSVAPLTYEALRQLTAKTVRELNAHGIGRNDRVAIVLDNGPHMAAAFLAIACGATAAPLNPAYRADEFVFYLSDLQAKLLIVGEHSDSAALEVAARLAIPVAQLRGSVTHAGQFELVFPDTVAPREAAQPGAAQPEDVALLLHTSGTTSRPKIVPLKQRNLTASAYNIGRTLAFTPADRGLNIMPLFHIHGLIAGILAPLAAGSEVFCTPGFNALKFFGWMAEAKPTWYSGVPTMHQAILSRASKSADVIRANPLRFIRSSSSSLPPRVIRELETVFGTPVIEAYSMTEAAHQMTSNPLPPGKRKPGSVGVAAGPEVCILGPDGEPAPHGVTGEIAIRGPNVMSGYESNPSANAEAFSHGWFRTGDQGVMDAEGYVTITGRLKEIINRGGEKISPREVDEVLMEHPAVAQCVTFAMPHDKLGEDVAAVVVLREGQIATERELRDFAATRLVDFKVPRKIVFRDEVPKGATGKLQRIGLAQKLGL
jgi:acyl-CoA synthetase (AMP-forming)/AMP-acid ligase II